MNLMLETVASGVERSVAWSCSELGELGGYSFTIMNMGVSISGVLLKSWMVYFMENPIKIFGATPILGNLHVT